MTQNWKSFGGERKSAALGRNINLLHYIFQGTKQGESSPDQLFTRESEITESRNPGQYYIDCTMPRINSILDLKPAFLLLTKPSLGNHLLINKATTPEWTKPISLTKISCNDPW